jgi:cysteine dioxygenase
MNMPSLIEQIEHHTEQLLEKSEIRTRDLVEMLASIELDSTDVQALMHPDVRHPYGRQVLFNHEKLEIMVATWTRDFPCAPHDHHDSRSAIRILRGRSHHRMFRCENGTLVETLSERKSMDDVLLCPPRQIHAMGDDGAEESLITLHAYAGSIDNMIVYSDSETLIVSGSCGAWIPDSSADILGRAEKHVLREFVPYSEGT